MELTFKPRLTKGRHLQTIDEAGPFCLVEAVGFNVDAKVDDAHASVDTVLAAMARTLNDRMCKHYVHPLAEAAGMIEPTSAICDACQARLWAVGERIAGTGYDVADWTEAERTALHVRLGIEAAEAAFKLVTRNTELWRLVGDALAAASACQTEPTPNNRAAARLAAERIDRGAVDDGNEPAAWAAHAAAHATRAAAALAGDTLDAVDTVTTTDFFANKRAVEAVTYALGATAGDPGRSMGVARRVLNTFGKATSQNGTPGVSEGLCQACQAPCPVGLCADCVDAGAHVSGEVYPDDAGAAAAEAAEPQDAEAAYREAYAEAEHHGCKECAEAAVKDAARVDAGFAYYVSAAPCAERTTVDGIGYGCVKVDEGHVEHVTALDASWWTEVAVTGAMLDAEAAAELDAVKADADDAYALAVEAAELDAAVAAEIAAPIPEAYVPLGNRAAYLAAAAALVADDDDVDDFEESELGDVADEAIGDAAALDDDLQRAEAMLTAIAAEHRPVAAWTRRRSNGVSVDIEYQTDCCVSCRDADGNPVPAPCRTLVILNSYGEA